MQREKIYCIKTREHTLKLRDGSERSIAKIERPGRVEVTIWPRSCEKRCACLDECRPTCDMRRRRPVLALTIDLQVSSDLRAMQQRSTTSLRNECRHTTNVTDTY